MSIVDNAYPEGTKFLTRKCKGYMKQTYKLQTLNIVTATAGQIITVDFPNNTIFDARSLTMHASLSTSTTAGYAFPPANADFTLFERQELTVNGSQVQMGANNYGQLGNIIANMTMGYDCESRRGLMQYSLGPPTNAGALALAANVGATTNPDNLVNFCVGNWVGFLSSVQPQYVNTQVCGNVRLRLTLAQNAVLIANAAATNPAFTLSNIYFTVDTIKIDDGIFDMLQMKYLNEGAIMEYCFRQWLSFSSSPTSLSQTTNFSFSSQSFNRAIGCFAIGAQSKIGTDYYDVVTHNSGYFTRPAYYLSTAAGSGITVGAGAVEYFPRLATWQFNIAGAYKPTFQADPLQAFTLTMNAMHHTADTVSGVTPRMAATNNATPWQYYAQNFWNCMVELEDGNDSKLVSGLDTRGNVSQNFFTTTALPNSTIPPNLLCLVFCEVTSTLQVGAGRQINVVP